MKRGLAYGAHPDNLAESIRRANTEAGAFALGLEVCGLPRITPEERRAAEAALDAQGICRAKGVQLPAYPVKP